MAFCGRVPDGDEDISNSEQVQKDNVDSRWSKTIPNEEATCGNAKLRESFRAREGERKDKIENTDAGQLTGEWERVMRLLQAENSELVLHNTIMNPLVPYSWCDYYLGDEVGRWIQSSSSPHNPHIDADVYDEHGDLKLPAPEHCQPLPEIAALQELDIIYCQVDFFETFRTQVLPLLSTPIILITGQWFLPQLEVSAMLEEVADHPMVAHWFAQNPVLDHPKYTGFPYGIRHTSLRQYAAFLLRHESRRTQHTTRSLLANLPVKRENGFARHVLPEAAHIPYDDFLGRVAGAQYLVSPAGDRADTYRHLEAIGLGTIPICNCPPQILRIYGTSMLRAELSESTRVDDGGDIVNQTILEMIQNPSILSLVPAPGVQKEMILASHWFRIILSKKSELARARSGARKVEALPCWTRSWGARGRSGREDGGLPLHQLSGICRQSVVLRMAPSHETWCNEEILTRERRIVVDRPSIANSSSSSFSSSDENRAAAALEKARAAVSAASGGVDLGDQCVQAFIKCRLSSSFYKDGILQRHVEEDLYVIFLMDSGSESKATTQMMPHLIHVHCGLPTRFHVQTHGVYQCPYQS